jgi:hypothetical protein
MSSRFDDRTPPAAPDPGERPDRETLQKLKEILGLFASAVAAMKIYPPHHENVLKARDELWDHLSVFLDTEAELEIGVEENAFTYRGEEAFRDPDAVRSLPYQFFKDGLQRLAFSRGLTREEVIEFLEVVKAHALLPLDRSDIVDALWECDFLHIRHFAPDEFLENKIAPGRVSDLRIDPLELYRGKIDLDPDDMKEVYERSLALSRKKDALDASSAEDLGEALDKNESLLLESMLSSEREHAGEREFLDLLFEVGYLEDRPARFRDLLAFLDGRHHHLVRTGDFSNALHLVDMIASLRSSLASFSVERAALAEDVLKKTIEAVQAEDLRPAATAETTNPRLFYEYLTRLGPRLLAAAAEIYEANASSAWRSAGFDFLQEAISTQKPALVALAQDAKPDFTKALIQLMAARPDRKSILQLASFVNYADPEIKREAVQALGAITESDDLANKILVEFLADPNERVRVEAAKAVRLERDRRALEKMLRSVSEKKFRETSDAEKEAVLGALARTEDREAAAALRALVEKAGLFGKAKREETRLGAVAALASMKSPLAREALKANVRNPDRKIAEACRKAIARRGAEGSRPGTVRS